MVELPQRVPVPGAGLGIVGRVVGHSESVPGWIELQRVTDRGVGERAFEQFGLPPWNEAAAAIYWPRPVAAISDMRPPRQSPVVPIADPVTSGLASR